MKAPAPSSAPSALEELFRDQPALEEALGGLSRAAASDAPVLLLGEPGSGRSVLARAVHASSSRWRGPLVEVDPTTIPATLFESELFGHRAGAFTGAERGAEGRVARAAGGSLVLDHVEGLPLPTQPKLLRLLAERRYRPLGGDERDADVRFIAIAGEELPQRVRRGVFRDDLYYRLEVLAFRVPPLRQRREDLPAVARSLAAELAGRLGRPELALTRKALGWMEGYGWPGNLRELRNVLERALIETRGSELDPPEPAGWAAARPRSLAEAEEAEIRKALAYTRGHQGRAAEVLGISRKALWEKRKRYGIP